MAHSAGWLHLGSIGDDVPRPAECAGTESVSSRPLERFDELMDTRSASLRGDLHVLDLAASQLVDVACVA
jgi:hypothetical protein